MQPPWSKVCAVWDLEPDNAAAYYNKGIALRNLEKYDEAIACYDKAIELEPDNAAAYYNKGIALQKHGNLDEAIEAYDEALKLDPSNEEAKKLKEQAEYGIANAPELDNPSFE